MCGCIRPSSDVGGIKINPVFSIPPHRADRPRRGASNLKSPEERKLTPPATACGKKSAAAPLRSRPTRYADIMTF
jgi:hypothetical protein